MTTKVFLLILSLWVPYLYAIKCMYSTNNEWEMFHLTYERTPASNVARFTTRLPGKGPIHHHPHPSKDSKGSSSSESSSDSDSSNESSSQKVSTTGIIIPTPPPEDNSTIETNLTYTLSIANAEEPEFFFGEKFCLDANSGFFPFSFSFWNTSVSTSKRTVRRQQLEQILDLPNIMPITFPCCCNYVAGHSIDCLCRHIPECGTTADEAGHTVGSMISQLLGGALGVLAAATKKRGEDRELHLKRGFESLYPESLKRQQLCPENNATVGEFYVPISFKIPWEGEDLDVALCFQIINNGFNIIDSDDLLALVESTDSKCKCEPWTQLEQQVILYFQYAWTMFDTVTEAFG